jgi:hypothetical protein
MSYGEIDRVPIDVVINVRMICFWNKLLTYNQQLSSILYRIMYMLSQRENVNFKWINHIKSIFDNVVMFGINLPVSTGIFKLQHLNLVIKALLFGDNLSK